MTTPTKTPPSTEPCWFCRADRGEDSPPGGWIYEDDRWRWWHVLAGWGPAGTTVVESRRHFLDFTDMNDAEHATLTELLGRVFTTVKRVVGADRVYTWATMDRHPHLHIWLVPWWEHSPARGPRYLLQEMEGAGCTSTEATQTAARLRAALAEDTIDSTEPGGT